MCVDPATMTVASKLLLAAQAASSVVGYFQASSQAKSQEAAIQANYAQQMEAAQEQQRQNNASAAQTMSERARESMIERGRLRAISGESGLAGVSTDRLFDQTRFNEGYDMATIEANRSNTSAQLYQEAKGLRAQSQSKMNAINRPSLIGTGLQIVGAVAGAGAEQERLKRASGPVTKQ